MEFFSNDRAYVRPSRRCGTVVGKSYLGSVYMGIVVQYDDGTHDRVEESDLAPVAMAEQLARRDLVLGGGVIAVLGAAVSRSPSPQRCS